MAMAKMPRAARSRHHGSRFSFAPRKQCSTMHTGNGPPEAGWMAIAGTASSGSKPGSRSLSRTNPPGRSFRSRTCISGGAASGCRGKEANRTVNRTFVFHEIIGMASS